VETYCARTCTRRTIYRPARLRSGVDRSRDLAVTFIASFNLPFTVRSGTTRAIARTMAESFSARSGSRRTPYVAKADGCFWAEPPISAVVRHEYHAARGFSHRRLCAQPSAAVVRVLVSRLAVKSTPWLNTLIGCLFLALCSRFRC